MGLTRVEAELALERLLDHHQKWLMAQPELLLLWPLDRMTRRRVADLLAKELLLIPKRDFNETTPPNRAMRRAILAQLNKSDPEWWGGVEGELRRLEAVAGPGVPAPEQDAVRGGGEEPDGPEGEGGRTEGKGAYYGEASPAPAGGA